MAARCWPVDALYVLGQESQGTIAAMDIGGTVPASQDGGRDGRKPTRWREELAGRILVLGAHPDDEAACGFLLQRARQAAVVVATDGAPVSEYFWGRYGSRRQYAAIRRAETTQALGLLGIADIHFLAHADHRFSDQQLHCGLHDAFQELSRIAQQFEPDALLAPAYEGGHPDHDSCSFLVHLVSGKLGIRAWEFPTYHRSSTGVVVHQAFRAPNGTEIELYPTPAELARRQQMIAAYASQPDICDYISAEAESYRPQPAYDYSCPPHPGLLNYEAWQWGVTGAELCAAFATCAARI